ncbi:MULTISPECIES: immunity 70 family protein [unclassified Listeria]|uniref:immunity 70 family protein n=1 Tax=unclassified Listeria TaxID=2642072 RepID=UPI000B58C629|nr:MULTISPECIES: immunity 70 family protein [unclassified Listeria]
MTVGIKVDFLWFPIGTGDFFHSFFSTICVNLENMNWGSEFPVVMKDVYAGYLSKEKIEIAQKELKEIKLRLSEISPEKIIWDAEDLDKIPPWGTHISKDITNLAQYFVTTDGKNLISVLEDAMEDAIKEDVDLEIKDL